MTTTSAASIDAAGLTGPAIGRALLAARAALLDGEALERESQLAVALRVASPGGR